jgi:DNA-binding NtrC family response regulator
MPIKKSILLVEDDWDLLEYTEELLKQLDYHVVAVETASKAFSVLEAGDQVDLILSDIRLTGDTSGIDFAKNVQARFPEIKILLVSGYDECFVRKKVQESFPFIEKPYRPENLQSKITALLEEGFVGNK